MTSLPLFLSGAGIVILVSYDVLRTAVSFAGLGPVSAALSHVLWAPFRRLAILSERRAGISLRAMIGPAILSTLTMTWVLLYLLGYSLLFLSGPSLRHSLTELPADAVETAAFVGSTLSTLGASTVSPSGGWWDMLSMVAALNGMVVLTLSVSLVLSIAQTTARLRTLAARHDAISRHREEAQADAASLGPDLCQVAVELTQAPLAALFVPDDARMSFPPARSSRSATSRRPPNGARAMTSARTTSPSCARASCSSGGISTDPGATPLTRRVDGRAATPSPRPADPL